VIFGVFILFYFVLFRFVLLFKSVALLFLYSCSVAIFGFLHYLIRVYQFGSLFVYQNSVFFFFHVFLCMYVSLSVVMV
jgi:hypothetical protein